MHPSPHCFVLSSLCMFTTAESPWLCLRMQSRTLRLTAARGVARAGRVPAFAGYSAEQETALEKTAMSHLICLGNRSRMFMTPELVAVYDLKIRGFIERRRRAGMSIAMMDAAAAARR
eukprot:3040569-Pleurochrysis_carterae.AAC.2